MPRTARVRQVMPGFDQEKGPRSGRAVSATTAKNDFGQILERAMKGDRVIITRHERPQAVLMSMDEYNTLARGTEAKLNTLTEQFDSMLERMQGPKARKALEAAFHATPRQLGRVALAAARKRG